VSLKTAIQNAATAGFNSVKDLQADITYSTRSESYSVATGTVTKTTTDVLLKAMFMDFTSQQRIQTGDILAEDYNVVFPAKDVAFTPTVQDTITKDSVDYEIITVDLDPAQALYSLQVRRR
jgi:hypothetical protein